MDRHEQDVVEPVPIAPVPTNVRFNVVQGGDGQFWVQVAFATPVGVFVTTIPAGEAEKLFEVGVKIARQAKIGLVIADAMPESPNGDGR